MYPFIRNKSIKRTNCFKEKRLKRQYEPGMHSKVLYVLIYVTVLNVF